MSPEEPTITALLEAHFDGRLSPQERLLLEDRLRRDPAARQEYLELAQWHAVFSTWAEEHPESGAVPVPMEYLPRSRPRWIAPLLAAAAAIAIIVTLSPRLFPPAERPLATVSYQRGAPWPKKMMAGEYALETGTVRFETTAGASVSLAAPARFTLLSPDRILLVSGRLTARMLHANARLTVKVGDLEVTDLGTAFGVDASESAKALVSVFDGEVALKSPDAAKVLKLSEGESMIHQDGGGAAEKTAYDPAAFRELWPLTMGIDEASHLVEFLSPGPLLRPLREYRANDRVFLFPEQQQIVVGEPLALDLSAEVRSWPEFPVSPYPLGKGTHVSSYFVFFQPARAGASRLRRLTGEITFQHRVVGVICTDGTLAASDAALGVAGADYSAPGERRGLEAMTQAGRRGRQLPHDSVLISEDGHTVRFDLYVSNEREQIRVLVDPK